MKPKYFIIPLLLMMLLVSSASAACPNSGTSTCSGSSCSGSTCSSACSSNLKIATCSTCANLATCSGGYCSATLKKGVKYNFYDTSLGSPNIRFWNFKNSSGKQIAYSSAKNAAFTFSKAGSYTVVLSVGKCSKGTWASCSSKCSKTVHVTVK